MCKRNLIGFFFCGKLREILTVMNKALSFLLFPPLGVPALCPKITLEKTEKTPD